MQLTNGYFTLKNRPFFLYSGEIHYFRIPKKQWAARLKTLKAAGFNAVSTYIPWIWHEPTEGRFDLTGETLPERDIVGFMDLAKKLGLSVSARVGPVSNAELVKEGIPLWLTDNYPDVFVTGRRDVGNLPHVTLISYLHPVFQEKVDRWYEAVLPVVAERQSTRGGPVVAVQLCNEIAMVHWLQKGADYKEHVNALYRTFLEEKYKTLDALNHAHGTHYVSFGEVPQPKSEEVSPDRLTRHVDWALFYRRYYATYFHGLAARARARGINVPLFCNIPQFYDYDVRGRGNWAPMTTSMFRDFPVLTPNLIFGGAYQMRHLDFENFHDVALTTEVTRMLGAVEVPVPPSAPAPGAWTAWPEFRPLAESPVPVVCAELQTGIMRDRPRLYPQQVLLNVKSSVGQGLSGVNAYMFAGGVNPPGLGAFGTYHDWQAPVGPDGEERPHLEPLKDFGKFLSWGGPLLAQTRKAVDTTFGFYLPYYATEYWSSPWVDALESQRTNLWYDGVARLAQLAGFSYNHADVQRASLEVLKQYPSLWVYSLDFMDGDTQLKLARYVQEGGKLILGPRIPTRDLQGRPNTLLADELGISVVGEQKGNVVRVGKTDEWVQGPLQTYTARGAAHVLVNHPTGAAVLMKEQGRGRVLAVGFGLPHVYDHFRQWLLDWTEALGVRPQITCDPWDVQAVLRRTEEFGFLFVFNYHFTERKARVSLPLPGSGKRLSLPGGTPSVLAPFSGWIWPVNVPVGNGVRIDHATAEVVSAGAQGRRARLVLASDPGARFELSLTLPGKPRTMARGPRWVWKNGHARAQITADKKRTEVSLTW